MSPMFKPNRTLLFLNHQANVNFHVSRLVFDAKVEKVQESSEASAAETLEVKKNLETLSDRYEWDSKLDPEKNLEEFSKKLYALDAKKQKIVQEVLKDWLSWRNPNNLTSDTEKLKKCKLMTIENGRLKFYFQNAAFSNYEIRLATTNVPITTPKETPQQAAESHLKKFQEWFPGKKVTIVGGMNPGKYIFNVDAGKPVTVYSEKKGMQLSSIAFENSSKVTVSVTDGSVVSVDGVQYVGITEAEIGIDGGTATKKEKIWVQKADLADKTITERVTIKDDIVKTESAAVAMKGPWGNPEKGNNTAETKGEIDGTGNHTLKNTADFYTYEGSQQPPVGYEKTVNVLDKNIYMINNEGYVRVQFQGHEGWIAAKNINSAEKLVVKVTAAEELQNRKDEGAKTRRAMLEHTDDGGLDFGDKDFERTYRLKDMYMEAEVGDSIEVTAKGATKARVATFNGKDFVYSNGEHAAIWQGYKLGEYKKGERAKENLVAPETANSIGSIVIKKDETRPGLRNYLEIAQTILNKDNTPEKLKEMGFTISNQELLDELRKNRPNPFVYQDTLKANQVGDLVFIIYETKSVERHVKEMLGRTSIRRSMEAAKLDARNKGIVDGKMADLEHRDLVSIDKDIVKLAKDEEKWNKVWEREDSTQIWGIERLINVWELIPPHNRSRNELRDLVREFIIESQSHGFLGLEGRVGTNIDLFFKTFKIYQKEDGTTGNFEDFKKEFATVESDYNKLDPKVLALFQDGRIDAVYERIVEQVKINRKRYGVNASNDKIFENLTPEEQKLSFLFISNDNLKIERYYYLTNVRNGSILMMDGIAELKYYSAPTESVPEGEMSTAERRINEIFDRNDKGRITESDVAGKKGQEGELVEFRLLPWLKGVPVLGLLATDWVNDEPDFFKMNSSGESAYVRIVNKCRNEKYEVDETKLVAQLNRLLQVGIWSMMSNPEINQEKMHKEFNINPQADDRAKILYERLKYKGKDTKEALSTALDEKTPEGKYRKALIQVGYLTDERASEGRIETYNSSSEMPQVTPEDVEKYSDNRFTRALQLKAKKAGYPPDKVSEIPKKLENNIVAGAVVDFGGDGRKPGVGAGIPIDIGHGFFAGIGVGYFNKQWQAGVTIGTEQEVAENLKAGLALATSISLNDGKFVPALGGGIEISFPIDDTSWKLFIAPGVHTNLLGDINGNPNIGVGVMAGLKWDPTKAVEQETKAKLKEHQLDKIEEALHEDRKKAVDLMLLHPQLGKLIMLLAANEEEAVEIYNEQKAALRNAAVDDVDPVITMIGVAAGLGIGTDGIGVNLGGVIAFNAGKYVTLYRRESRSTAQMMKGADEVMDKKIMEDAGKAFQGKEIKFSKINTFKEKTRIIPGVDGKPVIAIDAKESTFDFKATKGTKGLAEYNEKLKVSGVQLVEGKGEYAGLIEILIPELTHTTDTTYNKRTTRIYLDPAIERRGPSKGLILHGNRIFLAATANPDVVIKRFDYHTKFREGGAPENVIFTISDLPTRSVEEIARASEAFLYKSPRQELQILHAGDQWNVQKFDVYNRNKHAFEQYSEQDWTPYQDAVKKRRASFEQIKADEKPIVGLVDANLDTDTFARRFYSQPGASLEFKKLTTGETKNLAKLYELLDTAWSKDQLNNGRGLSLIEKDAIVLDLTRRSWADIRKFSEKVQKQKFEERLEWAHRVLLPIWEAKIKKINDDQQGTITFDAKSLLDFAIAKQQPTDLSEEPTKLPEGSLTLTLAGTERVEGLRTNNGADAVLGLKNYGQYLGQNTQEGQIARIILETTSPLPTKNSEFMRSPLALTVHNQPALVLAWGIEDFNRMTDLYNALKNGTFDAELQKTGYQEAFKNFKKLVTDIRELELKPNGGNMIKLPNGCFVKVHKPVDISTGVDKSCSNFTISAHEDIEVQVLTPEQGIALAARAGEHNTITANKVPGWISLGVAGVGTLKPEIPPPPPPERHPQPTAPKGGPGASVAEKGAQQTADTNPGKTGTVGAEIPKPVDAPAQEPTANAGDGG